jgi:hypothetical protein
MEGSDSYLVVEKMIGQDEILLSELERLLDVLEGQGQISPEERQTLLELARVSDADQNPSGVID